MAEGTWLKQQKKRNNLLWIAVIVIAIIVAGVIFLRNNSELLWGEKNEKKETESFSVNTGEPAATLPAKAPAVPQEKKLAQSDSSPVLQIRNAQPESRPAPQQVRIPLPAPEPAKTQASTQLQQTVAPQPPAATPKPVELGTTSLLLTDIKCRLIDRSKPVISLSLELFFADNAALKKEILLKRDNLKIMVRKVISAKSLDDMVVETLRLELKNVLNGLLEKGKVTDIEFREFRIDKVE
jgi:flagellar basal body-associated protein FliL